MDTADNLQHADALQKTALWIRGCLLITALAWAISGAMLVSGYRQHCRLSLEGALPRINPNTASMASLVRLPGIGKARALDIIHYRQSRQPDGSAFRSAQDLESIRGIGPKTVDALAPWLTFETDEQAD